MRGISHVILGTTAVGAAGMAGMFPLDVVTLSAGVLGSLLPDIDHRDSYLGRRLPFLSFLFAMPGHRGPTHSLIAVALILTLMCALAGDFTHFRLGDAPGWSVAFLVGYVSHLLADAHTPKGIPLLWPTGFRFRMPLTVSTGGIGEFLLVLAYIGAGCGWVFAGGGQFPGMAA